MIEYLNRLPMLLLLALAFGVGLVARLEYMVWHSQKLPLSEKWASSIMLVFIYVLLVWIMKWLFV